MNEYKQYENKIMIRLGCLLICCMLASCTKTIDDVHFHGRITLDCNNQIPASNVEITIIRYFNTGKNGSERLGGTRTDNDGYYSLTTDVKERGTFMGYAINAYSTNTLHHREFSCSGRIHTEGSKDIEINCQGNLKKAYGFHIKNTSPYNTSDIFNSLIITLFFGQGLDYNDTIVTNLVGTNVDTTLYYFYGTQISYKYSFTKNNVFTETSDTIILNSKCIDTLNFNAFY